MNINFKNLAGKRFSRLVAIRFAGSTNGATLWESLCDCGAVVVVRASNLVRGNTRSCGCLKKERTSLRRTTHGASNSREYGIWQGIKNRCRNPRVKAYPNYGGRGISVCQRWADSFQDFIKDVGRAPSKQHTVDRINNDGDYEPGNVRWVTRLAQANNTRSNKHIGFLGESLTPCQWDRKMDFPIGTVNRRMHSGWSVEAAIKSPLRKA